jgi:hypothetical protein
MIVIIEKLFKDGDQETWVPIFLSFSTDADTEIFFMPQDGLQVKKYSVDSIEELNQLKEDWKNSVKLQKDGEE